MATQERLHKSLEILKSLSNHNQPLDQAKRKEKLHHCYAVAEAFSNPTIRISTSVPVLLEVTIETFLKLCDDSDSDVRMTSDECLNRIIRAVTDGHIGKVHIELLKEIKKNGSARSLRAALTRFSQLVSYIRPVKGKAYVINLFPKLIKIADRTEESIHETLAASLPNILKCLLNFSSDKDTKELLKAFLQNVIKPSAAIRRTSSTCISSICFHSKHSNVFIAYCIHYLLDVAVPVDINQSSCIILGVLNCLKGLVAQLKTLKQDNVVYFSKDTDQTGHISVNKLLQIYELCIHYLSSNDHNVVNAALDTLSVLLLNATEELQAKLLSPEGIDRCRIHKSLSVNNVRSPSQLSVATVTEDHIFAECELTETVESDIEKWIGESKLSVLNIPTSSQSIDKTDSIDTVESHTESLHYFDSPARITFKSPSVPDNLETFSDRLSDGSQESDDKILDGQSDFFDVDIGDYLDKSVPLIYCARLITKLFLLSGVPKQYLSDKIVRVSVKSSAISCLSHLLRLFPYGFYLFLDRNYSVSKSGQVRISSQRIDDVMVLKNHPDPQIRGLIGTLAADLLVTILNKTNLNYSTFCDEDLYKFSIAANLEIVSPCYTVKDFVCIWIKGLQDENSNSLRQTLLSLKGVLALLCESTNFDEAAPILDVLPTLLSNPYWLVKVALCDLVSSLSYIDVFHVTGDGLLQQKVIYNVLFEFLGDSDQRIRSAASSALSNIIERAYSDDYHPDENIATSKGIDLINQYLPDLCDSKSDKSLNWRHFVGNMPVPYSRISRSVCGQTEDFLSKIVAELHLSLLENHSKYFTFGCVEVLATLSNKFPCTVYRLAWGIPDRNSVNKDDSPKSDNSKGLLGLCVSFLLSSVHIYDIAFLTNLMTLTLNLYAGFAMFNVAPVDVSENPLKAWSMFPTSEYLRSLSDQYLLYIMKLLNIFHHVINDIVPVAPQSKTVLQHLPTTGTLSSPIKRRKNDDRKLSVGSGKLVTNEKDEKREMKNFNVGQFAGSQHYMKVFEMLRSAFVNYKVSLDPASSENFVELVRVTIQTLCVVLEVGTLNEFGKISEEILTYLKATFRLDKTLTVQCVQQLLKCLFETNLTSNLTDIFDENLKFTLEDENRSFYYNILQKPYQELSKCIQSLNNISKVECDGDSTIMGYLHRRDGKKPTTISRTSDKTLASYIRIFEPIVINSLKQYTITSDVIFQCQVLKLLSQLVQLRINYCLLDSDQVFKDFVLKQFEFIEDGLVPQAEKIIPRVFLFLVNLSYSKQHSKSIIDIPKIIQLCDGLMASGQDPRTHCIPALEPIVEDVFLFRSRTNTTDMKELETTREVILAMLLRLLEYEEVIRLVTVILEDSKYCTDDTEKWLRWSGQVSVVFLNLLRQDKIRIETLESFVCLRKFVFALNPNVFRPVDEVLVMLFQSPPLIRDEISIAKWLSKVILLLFIISPLKEGELLTKIETIKAEFSPGSIYENYVATADPLNVHNNADAFQDVRAEVVMARLIFRVVKIVCELISENGPRSDRFLVSQLSVFLLYCSHIFQTGSLCKVSQVAAALLKDPAQIKNTDTINNHFLKIGTSHPSLTFQFCHILSLLNYNSLPFWNKVLNYQWRSLNCCMVKLGASIVFCDYLNENITETKQLAWILSEQCDQIVDLVDEMPVVEFVSFVHRNSTLSKLFLSSMTQRCLSNKDAIFKTKILKCLENCHASQTGAAIKLLVPNLLCNRQTAISRMVVQLASRKIEFFLTMSKEEALEQLSKDDLFIIKEELHLRMLAKKHEALISLLNKVLVGFYDMSPMELTQTGDMKPEKIQKLDINKKWLLTQIQSKYQEGMLRKETSKVMEKLEYNELTSFMSSNDFNRVILRDCIENGVKMMLKYNLRKEPPILKAAVDKVLKEVSGVINGICSSHEEFLGSCDKHTRELFEDESFSVLVQNMSFALASLMEHLPKFPTLEISEIDSENISKFAVLGLEFISFMLEVDKTELNLNCLELLLDCSDKILKNSQFCNYLGMDVNFSWLCSAIDSLHLLTSFLLKRDRPLPCLDRNWLRTESEDHKINRAQTSCQRLYALTCWLYQIQNQYVKIPTFISYRIKSLTVCLARLPLVNSYSFVPNKVWKLGWQPELSGKFLTHVPPIPIEMLQEIDVLEEYIFRTTLLGWTTRQQFEETWMCFLSVLCSPEDNLDIADLSLARRASSLASKAITAQLLQTLRFPVLGNKNVSSIIHVPRNTPIPDRSISVKKLKVIQDRIENEYNEVCTGCLNQECRNVFANRNFEKLGERYSYAQMSVRYFMISTNSRLDSSGSFAEVMHDKRQKLLEESGLDVNSCLQFLLDYYTQFVDPNAKVADLRILHETVRSILYISDLFTDKAQFGWMLDKFLALSKIHSNEDELLHQYLIIGLCKAVAVVTPDLEVYEQTKKLLVQFLKSPFLPTRISCLYGLLYVLEGCILSNICIGGVSDELQLILPCACEYVQVHLTSTNRVLMQSTEHTMLTWSLAFYIIENVDESHVEANFVTTTLQTAFARVQGKKFVDCVDRSIIKALERLLLVKPIYILEKVGKSLQKLALDKMKDENPSVSILGVQLLITYMYVDCWEHLERPGTEIEQSSPDHLVQTIEKISAIFERVKKSYVNEAKVLCAVLPSILKDFFSPSDILTKVIGEFLSPQQPHPKLMSEVVFQVFDSAIQLNQLSLLQDWVVFSLSNFTQSFSNMATWSLTCFFISASPNEWLRSFFPYVQARVGRYEYDDRKIFCIAGTDFYKNLTSDHQRITFVDSFVKVRDHPDMPFSDLLNSL